MDDATNEIVRQRAGGLCEYCHLPEAHVLIPFHIEHVTAKQHGGTDSLANLANACQRCNRSKGSDIGSIVWSTGQYCRFFNPRIDRWADHFVLVGATINPLTEIGEVTANILGFNNRE